MAGGESSILARGRLCSAGKGRGSAQGLTYDRFVLMDGVGRRPTVACGGGWRFLPLELLLRWRGGAGVVSNDTRRWCGVVWSC
jgi:DMSO/TMAO reductase YedYZ molybdopterin-dependent catalytic subunit